MLGRIRLPMRALLASGVALIVLGVFFAGAAPVLAGDDNGGKTKVYAFSDPTAPVGKSKLKRDDDSVRFKIETSELQPNAAHTIWFVVFNDPSSCIGGCGGDDIFAVPPRGDSAAFWAAGAVSNGAGMATFWGYVEEGEVPGGFDQILQDNTGGMGLKNAEGAEIHLVVRTHGDASDDPDTLAEQLSTFNQACAPTCANVQFAIHMPPMDDDD